MKTGNLKIGNWKINLMDFALFYQSSKLSYLICKDVFKQVQAKTVFISEMTISMEKVMLSFLMKKGKIKIVSKVKLNYYLISRQGIKLI